MFGGIAFVFIVVFMSIFISMSNSDIEELIVCSSNNESSYIPQSLCNYYLINHRGTKGDVQLLESRSGISFVFGVVDEKKRNKLFDFLVEKNIDINKVSSIDGFSPLHAAVLEKDEKLVKKLLELGADKSIISTSANQTALIMAKKLQGDGQGDYKEIIKLLSD